MHQEAALPPLLDGVSASDSTIQGYTYTQATEYVYNAEGAVSEFIDYVVGERYLYRYDAIGRVESVSCYYLDGTTVMITDKINQQYDQYNRPSTLNYIHKLGTSTYTFNSSYTYDLLGRVSSYTENGFSTAYTYLPMGMLDKQTATNGVFSIETEHAYEEGNGSEGTIHELTGRVSGSTVTVKYSTTQKAQTAYTYTYDDEGNITHIYVGGVLKYSYVYDNLNQLTRENNAYTGKTYVYTYDNAGNILTKKTYAYTTGTLGSVQSTNTYSYGNSSWGDQLTAFNGISFTYDALGNPLQYYNGNSYTFTWQKGRRLSKTVNGGVTTTYSYNSDGIRTGKTVGGVAVEYVLNGTQILAEKNGDHIIRYFYDAQGIPVGMTFNGTIYLFEKNNQGDVIAMWTASGAKVASYVYDAWGNIVSESVMSSHKTASDHNPFRYRGYYYDRETGFYYLQSRYYDPATGRFINADDFDVILATPEVLTDKNLYAYCDNNSIMREDGDGEFWNVIIGGFVGGVVSAASTFLSGGSVSEIIVSGVCGTISGAFAATGVGGILGQIIVDGVTSAIDSGYQNYIDYQKGEISLGEAVVSTMTDTLSGMLFSAMGYEGTDALQYSNKLRRETHDALKEFTQAAIHPSVKRKARKIIRRAERYIRNVFFDTLKGDCISTVVGYGVNRLTNLIYNYYDT